MANGDISEKGNGSALTLENISSVYLPTVQNDGTSKVVKSTIDALVDEKLTQYLENIRANRQVFLDVVNAYESNGFSWNYDFMKNIDFFDNKQLSRNILLRTQCIIETGTDYKVPRNGFLNYHGKYSSVLKDINSDFETEKLYKITCPLTYFGAFSFIIPKLEKRDCKNIVFFNNGMNHYYDILEFIQNTNYGYKEEILYTQDSLVKNIKNAYESLQNEINKRNNAEAERLKRISGIERAELANLGKYE